MAEIDWRGHGYDSRQLGGLLAEVAGLFNTRHRADADVAALVAPLAATLPSGETACSEMLVNAMNPTMRITADGALFEAKDATKARGYRWNPAIRRWWIEVPEHGAEIKRAWLAEHACCRHRPSDRSPGSSVTARDARISPRPSPAQATAKTAITTKKGTTMFSHDHDRPFNTRYTMTGATSAPPSDADAFQRTSPWSE